MIFKNPLAFFVIFFTFQVISVSGQMECDSLINNYGQLNFNAVFNSDSIAVGDEFCVTLQSENFTDIAGLQFTLGFNPSELIYVSQEVGDLIGPNIVNEDLIDKGLIGNVFFSATGDGVTLADNTDLITYCFELRTFTDECVGIELLENVIQSPSSEIIYLEGEDNICTSNLLKLNRGSKACLPITCTNLTLLEKSVCNSLTGNGSAELFACGGMPPYDFNVLKDGVIIYSEITNEDFSSVEVENLENGDYSAMVFDVAGAETVVTFEIEQLPTISYFEPSIVDPRCATAFNGSIGIEGIESGDGENVDVYFSNGFNYLDVEGAVVMSVLANGEYQITVEDSKGCQVLDTFILNTPPLALDIVAIPCCLSNSMAGYIKVTVRGGTPFSDGSYNINSTFAQFIESNSPCDDDAFDSTIDVYNLRVEDANGCILSQSIPFADLSSNVPGFIENPKDISISCDDQKLMVFDEWYESFGYGEINLGNSNVADYTFITMPNYEVLLAKVENCFENEEVEMEVWIEDVCGNISPSLSLKLKLLELIEFVGCSESCNTESEGCHSCNVQELLDGFKSFTKPYDGNTVDWPLVLCGGGAPENISWFSFIAGAPELNVRISTSNCTTSGTFLGLESGIFDGCKDEGGTCIGGSNNCDSTSTDFSYVIDNLLVGKKYYLYVDGCDGSECDYEIIIDKGLEFVLDTPQEITINGCQVVGSTAYIFCPQAELQFGVLHAGDSPSDFGVYDGPGPYNPTICCDYYWTISPPINGLTEGSWNPCEGGEIAPTINFDVVTVETIFEICLTDIVSECSEVECDDCCLEFIIKPLDQEIFGSYDVCVSELLESWDFAQLGVDPNGDGVGWLSSPIELSQVENAILNSNGLIVNTVIDSMCGCEYDQIVQINPKGNLERGVLDVKMFDCQFRDGDNNLVGYVFDVNGSEQVLSVDYDSTEATWHSSSSDIDWQNMSCDSLVIITVDTAIVNGQLYENVAAGTYNLYEFIIDTVRLELHHPNHPKITPDYKNMRWIDSDDMIQFVGNSYESTATKSGEYFIEVDYTFDDVVFNSGDRFNCSKRFGPYQLSFLSGTEDVILGIDHKIIPNPNKGLFRLQLESGPNGQMVIEIYNISGQKIATRTFDGSNFDFNISEQPRGTYIYKILDQSGRHGYGRLILI